MADKKVFTKEQVEQMVEDYYSNGISKCPDCSIRAEPIVTEASGIPKHFSFICPKCETTGGKQDDKYYNKSSWTIDQKNTMVESYWSNRMVQCPIDNSFLKLKERKSMGSTKTHLSVLCTRCGNSLDTKDLGK